MYADIVVLTYQSPDINYFTYLIPQNLEKEIKVGQLVEVPFGSRTPIGLVVGVNSEQSSHPEPFDRHSGRSEESQGKLREGSRDSSSLTQNDKRIVVKPLNSILFPQPLFLPYQIELLKWMSAYYMAPMVNCLEVILPKLPSKLLIENSKWKETVRHKNSIHLDPHPASRGRIASSAYSPFTIHQTLVLVPTLNRIPETLAKFPSAKNYAIYHGELKASEKFDIWMKILSGQVDYIFGSRNSIFAPCPNLSEIVIFDEHDGAYKDERSPYFGTLTVAQKISALTRANIKIVDRAPKIQTYFQTFYSHSEQREESRSFVPLTGTQDDKKTLQIKIPTTHARAKIVDMREEKLGDNYSPISDFLLEELKKNAKVGKNSLLFLNKKKEAGTLFCKNCKNHDYLENAPSVCPNCKSADIYFNVLNLVSLEKEVKRLIPGAKVNKTSQSQRFTIYDLRFTNIDIATASIFYSPNIKKYGLAAYIQPDPLLTRADFSSAELLYSQIANLKSLLVENGLLIVQSSNSDDSNLKTATSGDYQTFYKNQLENRRALSYPPFALLVKITVKGKSAEKVEKSAQKLSDDLKYKILNTRYDIQILGPFKPIFFYKIPQFNIIIKYKLDSYTLTGREKAVKDLQDLRKLKDVQITVEPESIN